MFKDNEYYVGIDLGGTTIKLGVLDELGNIISKKEEPTPKYKYLETLDIFVDLIKQINIPLDKIKGIGIGVPGFVDIDKGVVNQLVNVGWENVNLKKDLEEKIGIPVYVDNDGNLAALGEYWLGSAQGISNFICITIGTGIGAGIIIDGNIYHGLNAMAGEIGHMPVNPTSKKRCNCGKYGCLETEASATAILNNYLNNNLSNNDISVKDIFQLAENGDTKATKAIDNAGYYLGLALAQISHALAPEKIVVGGGVSKAGLKILEPIKHYFNENSLDRISDNTDIVLAKLQNDAGIIGAAYLAKINN